MEDDIETEELNMTITSKGEYWVELVFKKGKTEKEADKICDRLFDDEGQRKPQGVQVQ